LIYSVVVTRLPVCVYATVFCYARLPDSAAFLGLVCVWLLYIRSSLRCRTHVLYVAVRLRTVIVIWLFRSFARCSTFLIRCCSGLICVAVVSRCRLRSVRSLVVSRFCFAFPRVVPLRLRFTLCSRLIYCAAPFCCAFGLPFISTPRRAFTFTLLRCTGAFPVTAYVSRLLLRVEQLFVAYFARKCCVSFLRCVYGPLHPVCLCRSRCLVVP